MALFYKVNPPPGGADTNDVDYGKLSTEAAFNDIHGALSAITFPTAEQFLALKKEMKGIIRSGPPVRVVGLFDLFVARLPIIVAFIPRRI